jgi:hypothetical protein
MAMGYHIGDELVCMDCIRESEAQDLDEDDALMIAIPPPACDRCGNVLKNTFERKREAAEAVQRKSKNKKPN